MHQLVQALRCVKLGPGGGFCRTWRRRSARRGVRGVFACRFMCHACCGGDVFSTTRLFVGAGASVSGSGLPPISNGSVALCEQGDSNMFCRRGWVCACVTILCWSIVCIAKSGENTAGPENGASAFGQHGRGWHESDCIVGKLFILLPLSKRLLFSCVANELPRTTVCLRRVETFFFFRDSLPRYRCATHDRVYRVHSTENVPVGGFRGITPAGR